MTLMINNRMINNRMINSDSSAISKIDIKINSSKINKELAGE